MKHLATRYIVFTLGAEQDTHRFILPPGLIYVRNSKEKLKLTCRKLIYRNDFETIGPVIGDTLYIDGIAAVVRQGSPNVLALVAELNTKSAVLQWEFDTYDGHLYLTNTDTVAHTVDPGAVGHVLGMTEPVTVQPAQTFRMQRGVDLAPPEAVFVRMLSLSSSSLEITQTDVLGAKSRDLLCVVGNDVPAYATGVYRDINGIFGQWLGVPTVTELTFKLMDAYDRPLRSKNVITMIGAIETWVDDEAEILNTLRETNQINGLRLLKEDMAAAPGVD